MLMILMSVLLSCIAWCYDKHVARVKPAVNFILFESMLGTFVYAMLT